MPPLKTQNPSLSLYGKSKCRVGIAHPTPSTSTKIYGTDESNLVQHGGCYMIKMQNLRSTFLILHFNTTGERKNGWDKKREARVMSNE